MVPSSSRQRTAAKFEQFDLLYHQAEEWLASQQDDRLRAVIEQLHTTMEELRVAEEEIVTQNEELLAAQQALERAQQHYRELFELAPDGYLVTTASGLVLEANRAAADLLGVSLDYLHRRPLAVFVEMTDRRWFRTLLERAQQQPGPVEQDIVMQARSRGAFTAAVKVVHTQEGMVQGFRWVIRDVTEQRRQETARAQALDREYIAHFEADSQRRRLETVLEQVPEGVVILDVASDQIVFANEAAEELAGQALRNRSFVEGWQQVRFVNGRGEPLAASERPLARARRGDPVRGEEFLIEQDGGGQRTTVLINAVPVYDQTGKMTEVVAVYQDISHRKTVERLKEEFLSLVAHELRTPLTTLKGYSQLIQRQLRQSDGVLTPRHRAMLDEIESGVESMISLVSDLLDLIRLEIGRFTVAPRAMDLAALLQRAVHEAQTLHPELPIVLDGADHPVMGRWDWVRLGQVFGNLLDNAAKYNRGGGHVWVMLEASHGPDGREAHVAVRDEGIGIPSNDLAYVFDRHFRARNSGSGSSGLGLGLYLSRQIVEQHGGRIWVESRVGRGSTFHVVLPLAVGAVT